MRPKITQHWGDCTFYSSLVNHNPTDGICTCGYGWTVFVDSGGVDESQLLSEERMALRSGQSVDEQLKQHAASLTQENEHLRREVMRVSQNASTEHLALVRENERLRADIEKTKSQRDEYIRKSVDIDSKLHAAKDALEAARPFVKHRLIDRGESCGGDEVLEQIEAVLNPAQGAEPSKTCHICGKLKSEPGELWCSGGHIRRSPVERTPSEGPTADGLLPCPFCGAEANIRESELLDTVRKTAGCNTEHCQGYQSMQTFATHREAKEAWNMRVNDADLAKANREIDRLRGVLQQIVDADDAAIAELKARGLVAADYDCVISRIAREALQAKPTQQNNP